MENPEAVTKLWVLSKWNIFAVTDIYLRFQRTPKSQAGNKIETTKGQKHANHPRTYTQLKPSFLHSNEEFKRQPHINAWMSLGACTFRLRHS